MCCGVVRTSVSSEWHCTVHPADKLCMRDLENVQARLPEGTQTHFRSIVTDQHCRVLGSEGTIYAIGDAATIQQVHPRLLCVLDQRALERLSHLSQTLWAVWADTCNIICSAC